MKASDTSLRGSIYEKIFYKSVKIIPYSFITKFVFLGSFLNANVKYYYSMITRRKKIFSDVVYHINYNRIDGDYFEFGCHSGYGLSIFHSAIASQKINKMRFFAFDSFEGFPTITETDNYHAYKKGMLAYAYEEFQQVLKVNKMNDVIPIKGFFEDVLTDELKGRYEMNHAAIVFIDCDLYASTKVVLEFIKSMLQTGTIVIFDDYWIFRGDENRGEQKALSEFQQKYPHIKFREFLYPYSCFSKIFLVNIV